MFSNGNSLQILAQTTTATISGASGEYIPVPQFSTAEGDTLPFTVIGSGGGASMQINDATSPAVIAAINSAVASGAFAPVTYSSQALPAPDAGTVGYAVDSISGSVLNEPGGYGAVLDVAGGATTVSLNASQPQLFVSGSQPVALYAAAGGVGSISAGAGSSLFVVPNADGGAYHYSGVGGSDTILALSGSQYVTLLNPGNLVFLGTGADTYTGVQGSDTVNATGGIDMISEGYRSTVFLNSGTNTLNTSLFDTVYAGGGADTINAFDGGDLIVNQAATLSVITGELYQVATPFFFPSTVLGGAGSLVFTGGEAASQLGDIGLVYPAVPDLVVGGSAGNNRITAGSSGAIIVGGGAGDVLTASPYQQFKTLIIAGPGAETISAAASAGAETLFGGSGPDLILGSAGPDIIEAGAEAATIVTGANQNLVGLAASAGAVVQSAGQDTIFAGTGAATISATGPALVFGGSGSLALFTGGGSASLVGGAGSTTVNAGAGGGLFQGGAAGANLLAAGTGAATLIGAGTGDVLVAGGAAADILAAGTGAETLLGGAATGDNVFFAGSGPDLIQAGIGNDVIEAGTGGGTLSGGGGANLFVFASGHAGGTDLIADFTPGQDHLALQGYGTDAAAAVTAAQTPTPAGVMLTLPDGTQIVFAHLASIGTNSFV